MAQGAGALVVAQLSRSLQPVGRTYRAEVDEAYQVGMGRRARPGARFEGRLARRLAHREPWRPCQPFLPLSSPAGRPHRASRTHPTTAARRRRRRAASGAARATRLPGRLPIHLPTPAPAHLPTHPPIQPLIHRTLLPSPCSPQLLCTELQGAWGEAGAHPTAPAVQQALARLHEAADAIDGTHSPLQLEAVLLTCRAVQSLRAIGFSSADGLRTAERALQAAAWPRDATAALRAASAVLLPVIAQFYAKNDAELASQQAKGKAGASMLHSSGTTASLRTELESNAPSVVAHLITGAGAAAQWGGC